MDDRCPPSALPGRRPGPRPLATLPVWGFPSRRWRYYRFLAASPEGEDREILPLAGPASRPRSRLWSPG